MTVYIPAPAAGSVTDDVGSSRTNTHLLGTAYQSFSSGISAATIVVSSDVSYDHVRDRDDGDSYFSER